MTESGGACLGTGVTPAPIARRVLVTLLSRRLDLALLAIYYVLPLNRTSIVWRLRCSEPASLGLVGLIVFQVRSIIKAAYPALRAVGALATSAPCFCCCFQRRISSWADLSEQFQRDTDAYRCVVLHRHRFRHSWIRRHHRHERGGPSLGDGADGRRHRYRGDRRQDHR